LKKSAQEGKFSRTGLGELIHKEVEESAKGSVQALASGELIPNAGVKAEFQAKANKKGLQLDEGKIISLEDAIKVNNSLESTDQSYEDMGKYLKKAA